MRLKMSQLQNLAGVHSSTIANDSIGTAVMLFFYLFMIFSNLLFSLLRKREFLVFGQNFGEKV
jgi:hypothetical protein